MFRSFLKAIGVLFLVAALVVLAQAWEGIGKTATGERRARMERSPQWHQVSFENPEPIENHFFEIFKVSRSDDLSPKVPVPTGRSEPSRNRQRPARRRSRPSSRARRTAVQPVERDALCSRKNGPIDDVGGVKF